MLSNPPSTIHHPKSGFTPVALLGLLGVMLFAGPAWAGYPNPPMPYPTNNDPTNQIRFDTAAEADAKRQQLINWIWPDGLPTATLPSVTENIAFPYNLGGPGSIDQSLFSRIDMLNANVSEMDFHSISYLIHPVNTANVNRLAVVHQGHVYPREANKPSSNPLGAGIGNTANRLLQDGYSVIVMQMPLCGWNTDRTIEPPGGSTVTITSSLDSGQYHNEMFAKLAPVIGGGAVFRLFFEPVVQNINYFKSATGSPLGVAMTGVSGGGATTHVLAALDARIMLSMPTAGSAPLYVRNQKNWPSDMESVYFPLYDEDIAADGSGGGVATWMEIYALGGYGDGRRQIMVNNEFDYTSFLGRYADSFKDIVSGVVADDLGTGQWEHVLDSSHVGHRISPWAQENVFMPALAAMPVPEPSACVLGATGLLGFGLYAWRKGKPRKCWMLDGGWWMCRGRRVRHPKSAVPRTFSRRTCPPCDGGR